MRRLLLALCFLFGCSSGPTFEVEDRWSPLKRIQESKHVPDGEVVTIFSTMYVHDLNQWLKQHNGMAYEAILVHESTHASREIYGPGGFFVWFPRYVFSSEFRWEEEKVAWKKEIEFRAGRGLWLFGFDIGFYAKALSGDEYTVLGTPMVSFTEAYEWIRKVARQ